MSEMQGITVSHETMNGAQVSTHTINPLPGAASSEPPRLRSKDVLAVSGRSPTVDLIGAKTQEGDAPKLSSSELREEEAGRGVLCK
eukprot:scaffold2131_cov384-Prasinococcus_capsulatus_cf.AAC.10